MPLIQIPPLPAPGRMAAGAAAERSPSKLPFAGDPCKFEPPGGRGSRPGKYPVCGRGFAAALP